MSKVGFFAFNLYHGKGEVGSTTIRVDNVVKYWQEAERFKYGQKYDTVIFQKVYMQADWKFHEHLECTKILDMCDPDWLDYQFVKKTIDNVDGVTCSSEELAKFLRQLTDKPVKHLPDRFDLEPVPKPRVHSGKIKKAVWFGYKHNAEILKTIIPSLEKRGISLLVISNDDPLAGRWGEADPYKKMYEYIKYDESTIYDDLQKADVAILPQGFRPEDRFKSNNKTVKSWLAGLPVAKDSEHLDKLDDVVARQAEADKCYNKAIKEYDVKLSVKELKEFIDEIKTNK